MLSAGAYSRLSNSFDSISFSFKPTEKSTQLDQLASRRDLAAVKVGMSKDGFCDRVREIRLGAFADQPLRKMM
jgi:hypothetical protein